MLKFLALSLILAIVGTRAVAATKSRPTSSSRARSTGRSRSAISKSKPSPLGKPAPRSTGDHHVQVKAHITKNATRVPAHERTVPNKTQEDNWSTKGNSNPHTGKAGTKTAKK
jgi:hypothetical protein